MRGRSLSFSFGPGTRELEERSLFRPCWEAAWGDHPKLLDWLFMYLNSSSWPFSLDVRNLQLTPKPRSSSPAVHTVSIHGSRLFHRAAQRRLSCTAPVFTAAAAGPETHRTGSVDDRLQRGCSDVTGERGATGRERSVESRARAKWCSFCDP